MAPAPAATWGSNSGFFRLVLVVAVLSTLDLSSGADTLGVVPTPRLFHPGRHVCTAKKEMSTRLKRFEAFRRPVYQSYTHRCEDKICRGVRVVYETAYRDVTKGESSPSYHCCPGWATGPRTNIGCTNPVCSKTCQNNGTCAQPDQCSCLKGFTGQQCENDVDECSERKPCSQLCINFIGSYQCSCKSGYKLAPDLHSCIRKGKHKNVDGKFDVEILARKISRLEKLYRKSSKYELQTELSDNPSNEELQSSFDNLQKKFEAMNRYQQERWAQMEEDMDRLRPLCSRMESLENRLDQCACKCKEPVFSRIFP